MQQRTQDPRKRPPLDVHAGGVAKRARTGEGGDSPGFASAAPSPGPRRESLNNISGRREPAKYPGASPSSPQRTSSTLGTAADPRRSRSLQMTDAPNIATIAADHHVRDRGGTPHQSPRSGSATPLSRTATKDATKSSKVENLLQDLVTKISHITRWDSNFRNAEVNIARGKQRALLAADEGNARERDAVNANIREEKARVEKARAATEQAKSDMRQITHELFLTLEGLSTANTGTALLTITPSLDARFEALTTRLDAQDKKISDLEAHNKHLLAQNSQFDESLKKLGSFIGLDEAAKSDIPLSSRVAEMCLNYSKIQGEYGVVQSRQAEVNEKIESSELRHEEERKRLGEVLHALKDNVNDGYQAVQSWQAEFKKVVENSNRQHEEKHERLDGALQKLKDDLNDGLQIVQSRQAEGNTRIEDIERRLKEEERLDGALQKLKGDVDDGLQAVQSRQAEGNSRIEDIERRLKDEERLDGALQKLKDDVNDSLRRLKKLEVSSAKAATPPQALQAPPMAYNAPQLSAPYSTQHVQQPYTPRPAQNPQQLHAFGMTNTEQSIAGLQHQCNVTARAVQSLEQRYQNIMTEDLARSIITQFTHQMPQLQEVQGLAKEIMALKSDYGAIHSHVQQLDTTSLSFSTRLYALRAAMGQTDERMDKSVARMDELQRWKTNVTTTIDMLNATHAEQVSIVTGHDNDISDMQGALDRITPLQKQVAEVLSACDERYEILKSAIHDMGTTVEAADERVRSMEEQDLGIKLEYESKLITFIKENVEKLREHLHLAPVDFANRLWTKPAMNGGPKTHKSLNGSLANRGGRKAVHPDLDDEDDEDAEDPLTRP